MANKSTSPGGTTTFAEAQSLAATLPPLMAEAERVANTIEQGIHGRRRTGPGESFWQYRRYDVGDTANAVDWRQSARSQHLFVRENEWDASQSVWLWCDKSASMSYRSDFAPCLKRDRALVLGLALASLLTRAGERVAALGQDGMPTSGRTGLNQLSNHWLSKRPQTSAQSGLPPLQDLPRYATMVLIGDFLDPTEELSQRVRKLASSGATGHLVQVLDPAETDLPFEGRTEFEGIEEDLKLLVSRAETIRTAYQDRLGNHQAALQDMARSINWSFATHRTDHSATSALLSLYGVISGAPDAIEMARS
ncbi:MAG: DUF58 domain-containing protein [Parvibaculum sp.]|jgi:uncharacterized protein (DUF58 family)|nr:DUF58 domain-containing protein [Parvibaculum sp.]|tara:strand:+ start:67 stop:990 length:924 start_codon:yes stop_codon:yes gene_type:complete